LQPAPRSLMLSISLSHLPHQTLSPQPVRASVQLPLALRTSCCKRHPHTFVCMIVLMARRGKRAHRMSMPTTATLSRPTTCGWSSRSVKPTCARWREKSSTSSASKTPRCAAMSDFELGRSRSLLTHSLISGWPVNACHGKARSTVHSQSPESSCSSTEEKPRVCLAPPQNTVTEAVWNARAQLFKASGPINLIEPNTRGARSSSRERVAEVQALNPTLAEVLAFHHTSANSGNFRLSAPG
jgi:hypothetical protein